MKKSVLIVCMAMLCSLFVTAQNENTKQMQWSEFSKITDQRQQQRIFRDLPGENKYQLWCAKFDDLMKLDFTQEEKQHINALKEFVTANKQDLFISPSEKTEKILDGFQGKWIQTATEKFNWSKDLLRCIIASPGALTNEELKALR